MTDGRSNGAIVSPFADHAVGPNHVQVPETVSSANGANDAPDGNIQNFEAAVDPLPPPKRRRGRPPKNKNAQDAKQAPAEVVERVTRTRRGRPQGSRNRNSRSETGLQPHILTVQSGEDVVEKLREFSSTQKRSLCVLAASGSLSSATLMQVGHHGRGVGVTLGGHFTVLAISGSILLEQGGAQVSEDPQVFLSASLANPTGGVVGGTVAGPLEANGNTLIVIGHWAPTDSTVPFVIDTPIMIKPAQVPLTMNVPTQQLQSMDAQSPVSVFPVVTPVEGQSAHLPDVTAELERTSERNKGSVESGVLKNNVGNVAGVGGEIEKDKEPVVAKQAENDMFSQG